uniref:Uncharacterized protein n=1 Tax=Setaria italica TaxID=4555 RepID=K4AHE9_SETIT
MYVNYPLLIMANAKSVRSLQPMRYKLYMENLKGRSPPKWTRKTGLTPSLYLAPESQGSVSLILFYRAATEPYRKLLPTCTC